MPKLCKYGLDRQEFPFRDFKIIPPFNKNSITIERHLLLNCVQSDSTIYDPNLDQPSFWYLKCYTYKAKNFAYLLCMAYGF